MWVLCNSLRQCHCTIASRKGMADCGEGERGGVEECGGDSTALFMYLRV